MHAREHAQLLDALAAPGPNVISAAASVIDDPACRAAMTEPDVAVVWLHASPEILADRFASADEHRPAYGDVARGVPGRAGGPARAAAELASARSIVDVDEPAPDDAVARSRARSELRSASIGPWRTATALILDVDTGIDDSLALLYAAASPDAELVAATCVSGNVDARQVAINTRAVLELAGRTDVEVALGREVPLVRPLETTPETHGPRGLGHAELPPPSRAALGPPRGRRHPRRGPAPARRDHARHARAADQPRPRGPARAGAAAAPRAATR